MAISELKCRSFSHKYKTLYIVKLLSILQSGHFEMAVD